MNKKIFGAYDIRGKYPREINEAAISEIIGGLKKIFIPKTKLKAKIVLARDARLSSPGLYRAAIKQLATGDSRLKILPIGPATTPMFYFLVNYFKADGGIMITASHNPKEYNGLKIAGENATPIGGKEILKWII